MKSEDIAQRGCRIDIVEAFKE